MIFKVRSATIMICLSTIVFSACKSEKKRISSGIKNTKKPDIIFILQDDSGIMDSSAYAHKFSGAEASEMFYETPNIN